MQKISRYRILPLIRVLLGRWRTILICLTIGGLGACLYLLKTTKVYQAVAEIEMSMRNYIGENCCGEVNSSYDQDAAFHARIVKHVLTALEKMAIAEFRKQHAADEHSNAELTNFLRNKVSWSIGQKEGVVGGTGESSEPVFAARMVNVLAHYFVSHVIQENKAVSDEAVQWLNIQVEDTRAELNTIERQLAELRAESKAFPAGS